MSLKADDLKTVESYKKAIKLDFTKLSAQGNTRFWIYKDIELPTASGGKQKLPALLALVDDNAVKAVLKGKQPLCSGLSGFKDGEVFFEANRGKVPYGVMKKAVPLLLGKPLRVPAGEEDSGAEDEESFKLPPMPNAPTGTYARLNAAWKQLSAEADHRMGDPEQRAALTKLMDGIPDMLRSGELVEAEKRLAQMYAMLKNPSTAGGGKAPGGDSKEEGTPVPGLVKYRSALLQFGQAKTQVKAQIENLRHAIVQEAPDQKDFADDLASELEEFNSELQDVVDEAINVAKNAAAPANDRVKTKIRNYLHELAENPLVKKADANPLGVPVAIAKTLGIALSRIRDAMPA